MDWFVIYQDEKIPMEVTYKKRKTIGIRVEPKAIRVAAPLGISKTTLRKLLTSKEKWMIQKIEELRQRPKVPMSQTLGDGKTLYFLGKIYKLRVDQDPEQNGAEVFCYGDEIVISSSSEVPEEHRDALKKWYITQAEKQIQACIADIAPAIDRKPNRVVLKDQKTRWGSCSSLRNLNFNWRIVMAPPEVLDYVVVHEMCHLIHMNHSKDFWSLVAKLRPGYKEQRKWLKDHGHLLVF